MGPGKADQPEWFSGIHLGSEKKKGEAIRELTQRKLEGIGPSLPSGGRRGHWAGKPGKPPAPTL